MTIPAGNSHPVLTHSKEQHVSGLESILYHIGCRFIAEFGDKTQLETLLFATDKTLSKNTVFLAASAALIATSALEVLAGTLIAEYINAR